MRITTDFGAQCACVSALLATVLLVGCNDVDRLPSTDHDHDHEPASAAGRLVFAEVEGLHSHLHVYDLADAGRVGEFELDHAVTAIQASPGQRYAVVIQRNDDRVNFIDGGLFSEAHGDHDHLTETPPQLMSLVLEGVRPTHYQTFGEHAALFYDGLQASNQVAGISLFSDASIGSGIEVATYALSTFQHGTAEPRGDWMLTTHREATAEGTLPNQVDLLFLHGDHFDFERRFEATCEGLHGSASNDGHSVFGCTDGVLVVHQEGPGASGFTAVKIPVPERIGTLFGHPEQSLFAGFAGRNLYAIDPVAGTATEVAWHNDVEGLAKLAHSLDAHGERLMVLDSDGALHLLDVGEGFETVAVVPQVVDASGQGVVIAASHATAQAFISDPANERITVIDLDHAEVDDHIDLGFAPVGLAWVGIPAHADHGGEHGQEDHAH